MIGARVKCPECQTKVTAKARWCPSCGAELPTTEAPAADAAAPGEAGRTGVAWSAPRRVTAILVLVLVGLLVAATLVFLDKRGSTISDKQQTASSVRDAVLSRASAGSIAAYTVTAATHEKDNAAAEKFMTSKMAVKYTNQVTAAQWKTLAAGGAKQTSKVAADGVVSMTANTARVFVLIVVTTTAKNTSSNSVVAYRLNVDMVKQGSAWMIDDMNVVL